MDDGLQERDPGPVGACLRGELSPHVAVCRLLLDGYDPAAIAAAIRAARPAPETPRWVALAGLVESRMAQLDGLAEALRGIGGGHATMDRVEDIAAIFDHLAAHSPESAVALYSLGEPDVLAAATAEIVAWLHAESLLPPGATVLDVGCGFGRVAAAIAPVCGSVLGIDVSLAMIEAAQARYGDVPGLRFAVSDGRTLPAGGFDLVLMVDSMPYAVAAGCAESLVADAASRLTRRGALAVLNLSYGRDAGADARDAARWATQHRWRLGIAHPFKVWDGTAFLFRAYPAR